MVSKSMIDMITLFYFRQQNEVLNVETTMLEKFSRRVDSRPGSSRIPSATSTHQYAGLEVQVEI